MISLNLIASLKVHLENSHTAGRASTYVLGGEGGQNSVPNTLLAFHILQCIVYIQADKHHIFSL